MKTWKALATPFMVLLSLPVLILQLAPAPLAFPGSPAVASTLAVSGVQRINKVTGAGSINATDRRFDVQGTDLGIMWDGGQGQVLIAFGDTYGKEWGGCGSGPKHANWRSNTLAFSADPTPAGGLTFSTMLKDSAGLAREIIPSLKQDRIEETVIPTAGISVGTRNYLHFMSVNQWVAPGTWNTNYAGLAYSDDHGQTWTISPEARWENSAPDWKDKFQQAALIKDNGYVYLFATPGGRLGDAYLARVPEQAVLDKASYQYWDGRQWRTGQPDAAMPVVSGPVGELSVQYNSYFNRYLMTYLDESKGAIVLRDAANLPGPWSDPQVLVSGKEYSQLYGGFIHPWFNQGPELYFTISQWCAPETPYNVSFMKAELRLKDTGPAPTLTPLRQIDLSKFNHPPVALWQ